MNLGMILNAPYPPDMRVKKETDALIKAGFTIHLLCLRKKNEATTEIVNGVHVTRIDAGKNNVQLAFWDMVIAFTFQHPVFKKKMQKWIRTNNLSVIHVHDLPLVGTALALRKKFNLTIIADFHENYPEGLRTWFAWKKGLAVKLKNRMFMNPDRWENHERTAVLKSDRVIAVVEEMKKRLLQKYQPTVDTIHVISNTEEKAFINQEIDPAVYSGFANKFKILYSGSIGPHRGVDTAVEAMQYLKGYHDIEFIIVGSGSKDVMNHLKTLAGRLSVTDHVHFLGYQSFKKFFSYMHFADVNIIPHKSNLHTDNTIPHKLFQAMMAARPVLVSSSDPLKRIISTHHAGLVFEAGNAKDFADKILELYNDRAQAAALGENGKNITLHGDLNWDTEQKNLVTFYKDVFNQLT